MLKKQLTVLKDLEKPFTVLNEPFCTRSNYFYHKFSDLEIQLAGPDQLQPKPNPDELEFGKTFTDHMCKIEFENRVNGWKKPKILPLENISLHPAAKVLHYAIEVGARFVKQTLHKTCGYVKDDSSVVFRLKATHNTL